VERVSFQPEIKSEGVMKDESGDNENAKLTCVNEGESKVDSKGVMH